MIKIYFSVNKLPGYDIDLAGNETDFMELNYKLRAFLESDKQEITVEADTKVKPFPCGKMLEKLIISKSNHPVLISVIDEKNLKVEGSTDCLDAFVSNIEFVENGYHIHYEYYDGNEWISPDSLPLVISSRK